MKTLPGLTELISGDLNLAGQIRPVQVEDVLGRQQVVVDLELVSSYVKDRVVMVTGAGGSIGSELCRQLARLGAGRLVLVDKGEPPLFEIERELVEERELPGGERGARRLQRPREDARRSSSATSRRSSSTPPRTSTSPMLESNPMQAVSNNILGTRNLVEAAIEADGRALRADLDRQGGEPAERDGPVEGACASGSIESYALRDDVATRFVAVRFGNVLGLVRLGDPDLPPADRARRPGHGHATRT